MLQKHPPQSIRGGTGQLALAHPRLPPDQQRTGSGQRRVDGFDLAQFKLMAQGQVGVGGSQFDGLGFDGDEVH